MSLLLDAKYVNLLSPHLRNFKRKGDHKWNFSCPICGDSTRVKLKARGNMYRRGDAVLYKCFNCGRSTNMGGFLKEFDEELYREYSVERFLEEKGTHARTSEPEPETQVIPDAPVSNTSLLNGLPTIASLPVEHPAKQYFKARQIPNQYYSSFYYTDDFAGLTEKIAPGQYHLRSRDKRIVIPMMSEDQQLLAVQGRSIDPSSNLRYVTIKTHPDNPKVFGLDRIDRGLAQPSGQRRIYIVEGVFDSLFLPNCIAVTGADIPKTISPARSVVVWDNEPRNHEICERMMKAIENGFKICIWPNTIKEKDINDMILAGYTRRKVREIIDTSVSGGTEARLKLGKWRRDK